MGSQIPLDNSLLRAWDYKRSLRERRLKVRKNMSGHWRTQIFMDHGEEIERKKWSL